MNLLKELTEAYGAPGFEGAVRKIIKKELEKAGASILTDRLGGIVGEKKGTESDVKILLAGHMDEVGFMVKEITKEGYLYFAPLGGWWDQVLLAQRVKVITEKKEFTGVIGSKPPHILTAEERSKVYPMKEMFIDIGAKSDEMVKKWGIQVGDPILPICPYELLSDNDTILAKAMDNRAGCYLALETLKGLQNGQHPNTVYAGATVQEEVGLRGATTLPYIIDPDIAIALDMGISKDDPSHSGSKNVSLGKGPLITFLDSSMIPNVRFRNFIIETAEKNNIPYQVDLLLGGGTDAGKFHMHKAGIPSIVIGVATRYMHSHASMASKQDLENAVKLLVALVNALDKKTVNQFINY
ncbi:M42 family metallopeptidase [Falsibacillus albus]|uniref:M42 family peptidase n=1 Tax=Falsibacillus albus TaxID=2478915 RepID=A0A3L7K0V6_9BACI|nr:M42 family metallopeptidase [Falsibacillus albus]RLQ94282.1 M42 family peptidase [Falsibacillus albus]